jgi:hypothetical protein
MLLTNQRLDKLAAAHVDFTERGMLDGTVLSAALATIGRSWSPSTSPHAIITPILEFLCKDGLSNDDSGTDEDYIDGNTDDNDNSDSDTDDDNECDNDPVLAHVELARTVREWISHLFLL